MEKKYKVISFVGNKLVLFLIN